MICTRFPIQATGIGIVFARQAIQLVFSFLRPDAIGSAWLNVLRYLFPICLEIIGDHVALIVAARGQQTDLADAGIPAVRNDQLPFIFLPLAEFDIAAAQLARDMEARVVEGRTRLYVDVTRHRFAGHVRRHRLAHDDLRRNGRWNTVIARVAPFGADDGDAVDRQCRPVDRRAAQADIACLTLIPLHRDTGKTTGGLCNVLVRQAPHRVGCRHGNKRVRVTLHYQCGRFGLRNRARAVDDNNIAFAAFIRGGWCDILCLKRRGNKCKTDGHNGARSYGCAQMRASRCLCHQISPIRNYYVRERGHMQCDLQHSVVMMTDR